MSVAQPSDNENSFVMFQATGNFVTERKEILIL